MEKFLEAALRQNVHIEKEDLLYDKLPLVFKGRYSIYRIETNGFRWIAIEPKMDIGLVILRKDRAKIEGLVSLNCAIFFSSTTFYIKEKLLEEGIPFVIINKEIYLPFIGYLLSKSNQRDLAPVHLISYLTQKLIFMAIYEKWENVTVSQVARKLDVSKMSISRCFDEIEYLNIDILRKKGKSRVVHIPPDRKQLWETIRPILRNPVVKRYELTDDVHLNIRAGISALCEYSLLSDNEYPTYAITKKDLSKYDIKNKKQAHSYDEIGCVVLELGYLIDFNKMALEDPLSVSLSLTEVEKQEERISISIKDMMEEFVWSKD